MEKKGRMCKNRITRERFTAVVEETMDIMYRLSYGILNNVTDAEDAVAQSLLKAWEKLDHLKKEEQLRSWMIRIVINTSKSMLFRRGREVSFDQEKLTAGLIQEGPQETSLWSQVRELKETHRVVLLLYYYEGYSVKEIAGMLRVPEGTVKSRLARAREELGQIIVEDSKM